MKEPDRWRIVGGVRHQMGVVTACKENGFNMTLGKNWGWLILEFSICLILEMRAESGVRPRPLFTVKTRSSIRTKDNDLFDLYQLWSVSCPKVKLESFSNNK